MLTIKKLYLTQSNNVLSNVLLGINTFINPLYIYAQFRLYLQQNKDKIQYALSYFKTEQEDVLT